MPCRAASTVTGRNLSGKIDQFQYILQLLIAYEEKEYAIKKALPLPWLFHLRRALSVCPCEQVRVFMKNLGGYLFHIVMQAEDLGGRVSASWLHEDGIQAERDRNITVQDHPVHTILCLSDLYAKHTRKFSSDDMSRSPSADTLLLMREG